jgi:acyl-coenzyme A thioesterase PaaI-like protein
MNDAVKKPLSSIMREIHPLARHLEQHFVKLDDDGHVYMSIPFNPAFIGNTVDQSLHLGPITAVLDAAAGMAVMKAHGTFSPFVTLDLRVDQLEPANKNADIQVECFTYCKKDDLYYVQGIAWQESKNYPVLTFYSVFMAAPIKHNADGSQKQAPPMAVHNPPTVAAPRQIEFTAEPHPIHHIIPYSRDLELEVGRDELGNRIVKLPFADRHVGNPMTRALQGGVFLGFLECAGSAFILDFYPQLKQIGSASFFMEYLKAPKPEDTYASFKASKIGRRIVNIDISAFQTGRGEVAKASGRYLIRQ